MGLIDYKGKVCVVTGAASGIGLATVKLLLEEGAEVYAMDLADVSIGNTLALTCDLSDKDSIDTAFEKIPDHIDCYFGVAGVSGAISNYHKTFTVNYIANKYITETYLKTRMSNGGSICYVTSIAGSHWSKYSKEFQLFTRAKTWEEMINVLEYQAKPDSVGVMAYPFSKRAMNHYMASLSIELAEKGIRVNALLPGATDTGLRHEFEVEAGGKDKLLAQAGMAKRLANPEEMAKPLLFLNSDMASFISGTCLYVDYCNDAMIKLGLKKDLLDVKVGSKLYNLGFMQKMLKKQINGLNEENNKTDKEEKHLIAVTNDEELSDDDFRNKVEHFNDEVNENKKSEEEENDEPIKPDISDLKSVEDVNDEEEMVVITDAHEVTDEKKKEIHDEITKSFLDSDEEDVETL